MINVNTQHGQQPYPNHEGTEGETGTATAETSPNGGFERATESQKLYPPDGYIPGRDAQVGLTSAPLPSKPIATRAAAKTATTTIHDPAAEWRTVYQELSDIRAQLDQMPGGNVINQQGAIGCIAQIAGGDIETITNYFNEHKLNITLNQWNDFSPAVAAIRTELLRAQDAQILPGNIAQQTQTSLNVALEQAYDPSTNVAAIQTALDKARQSLESYTTQVVHNVKKELAAANRNVRYPVYREESARVHTRRARGWLGIFVGVAKLILAIEFVSKLVPLLALL